MNLRKLFLTFIILLLELFALWSLFVGLVGENSSGNSGGAELTNNRSHDANRQPAEYSPKVDKIVLIIIDAMRFDFVPHMKFVQDLLNEERNSCIFKVALDGPTVTLPRIKALVSGTTSSYWDILTNVQQSSSISTDNFIWRGNSAGKRIVFYGDDTWLKLFPGNAFKRYEGVSSFFVTDFYEVDSNVTRNVYQELNKLDFDMMILHYLGVDHVGHVHGPRHPLIPVKLEEMNRIVEDIYKKLRAVESDLPHLILVTGDHGMANQGGHGGDSLQEVTTPLISITIDSARKGQDSKRICQQNSALWKESSYPLKQVDISSIISYLWGLPFPESSRGLVPPEIRTQSPLTSQLDLLIYNVKHLSKFLSNQSQSHRTILENVQRLLEETMTLNKNQPPSPSVIADFENLLLEIRSAAVQDSNQNILSMFFSSLLLLQGSLLLILLNSSDLSALLQIFRKNAALPCLIVFIVLFVFTAIIPFIYVLVALITIFLGIELYTAWTFEAFKKYICKLDGSFFMMLLYFGSSVLYLSSSFVEEEHFASHFLHSSVILLSILCSSNRALSFTKTKMCSFFSLLALHRFCSVLNATGQKWNSLPDLNDVLNDWKLIELSALLSLGLIFLMMTTTLEKYSVVLIVIFKLRIFNLIFEDWNPSVEHWEGKLCYLSIAFSLIGGRLLGSENSVENSWSLLTALLQRRENIILVPLVSFQVKLIRTHFSGCHFNKFAVVLVNSLFFSAFFYQGNSNNITTIDISLGYTGLSTYNEHIVGVLTFISTFSLPILVILLSTTATNTDRQEAENTAVASSFKKIYTTNNHINNLFSTQLVIESLVLKISVTNFVYSVVLITMRQHLFIWSVFVPKLLYVIAFQCLILVILFGFILNGCIHSFLKQIRSKRVLKIR